MPYVIAFLEGIVTFISPCLLPMLPIYISYLIGGGEKTASRALKGALGFVLGFTAVFVALGALAGTVGGFLREYRAAVNIVSGIVVVCFGLSFLGVLRLPFFKGSKGQGKPRRTGFFSAVLFGVIFSVGWTPCVGAFLGSALMLAAQSAHAAEGMLMLLAYSLGLGVPFVISALLLEQLKGAFGWIKRNYKLINAISGGFLVLIGILMMTGLWERLLGLFG